jgi:CDP-glycerol glycerophosphotransferase
LPINRKILLYAPTYRDNNRNDQLVNINLQKTIDVLNKREDNWICLIRAHVASAGLRHDYASSDILDVSKYPDMADLLLISDMLITDYSSAAADFILCRKPTILAFFDYEEYTSNCRDLNYSFEDAGFLIARNQEELEKIIFSCNSEDYINNCNKIIKYFNVIENGNSSDAIVKIIDQHFTDLKQ